MSYLALNGDIVVQKGYFGLLEDTHVLVIYPIVSYQKVEVYRVETLEMGNILLTHLYQCKMQIQLSP